MYKHLLITLLVPMTSLRAQMVKKKEKKEKKSVYNAGEPGSNPGLRRSTRDGMGSSLGASRAVT